MSNRFRIIFVLQVKSNVLHCKFPFIRSHKSGLFVSSGVSMGSAEAWSILRETVASWGGLRVGLISDW